MRRQSPGVISLFLITTLQVFENQGEAAAIGAAGRATMVSTYSVPRVAEFVKFHLQRITRALDARDAALDRQLRGLSYRVPPMTSNQTQPRL